MSIKEQIIYELKKENYLSDRELTDRILGIHAAQQPINQACRKLEALGQLKRTTRPIRNYIQAETDTQKNNFTRIEPIMSTQEQAVSKNRGSIIRTKSKYLKNEFNVFWNSFWETDDKDYFSEISLSRLVNLKMATTNINNLITNEITIRAVKKIGKILNQDYSEVNCILQRIESKSANSNGYDIEWGGRSAYVCEVKANIPVKKTAFGSAQTQQITKDINALINGKSKSSITHIQLENYYKFLCLYGKSNSVIQAVGHLISKLDPQIREEVVIYQDGICVKPDYVYILFIDFNEND